MQTWWFPFYHPLALELHRKGQGVICAAREGEEIPDDVPSVAAERGIRGIYGATVRAAEEQGFNRMMIALTCGDDPSPFLDVPEDQWHRGLHRLEEAMEALRCAIPYLLGAEDAQVLFLVPSEDCAVGATVTGAVGGFCQWFRREAEELNITVSIQRDDHLGNQLTD
ncbi:hypothetical protein TheveDRAFT_1484 [Thermanaerovibrio velox DSM 12556]|uniref:Uncharacterized protein n=1 Tax=Thermanaerovibrio velox DSM 12556 TaxID=926567 RepID=H0UPH1_9BACT|nr:hypothetical protein [Thermanaerovibrio velox]EHM10602.1 hypothetical protein TheveDRAFT_1484 [Thermanaerovibrio velox DSM 12556]